MKIITFISICLLFVTEVSCADWQYCNSKMCWLQSPDLSETGIDVEITWPPLADDFECTETGPITGISIWASFFEDGLPAAGEDSLAFSLAIYADIPAGQQETWSMPTMPGEELWMRDFEPGQYTAIQVADNKPEDWYDPWEDNWSNDNHQQAYRYDFDITEEPSPQIEKGNIYWLAIYLLNPNPDEFRFGWKTSELQWNDNAVWLDLLGGGGWLPLTYPPGHECVGGKLDLAFEIEIIPEPASMLLLGLGGLALLRRKCSYGT